MATVLYVLTGLLGGISYPIDQNTNLLQAMYSDTTLSSGDFGWMTFIYIVFPILTYISSIPIAMIVSRLNFVAAKICSVEQATFLSVWLPILIGIPFQTGNYITLFGTYTSISFQALCNLIAPFLIFLFLSRRKTGNI